VRRSLFRKKEFDEENIPAVQRVFYPCAFVFGSLRKKIVQGSDQNRKLTETVYMLAGARRNVTKPGRVRRRLASALNASPLVVPVIARFFAIELKIPRL
jgi:hypothetical protein